MTFWQAKKNPQGVREIARKVGLNVGTVSHILFTLNSYKYV
ncbi:hypothetical protein DRJ00_08170 [Candidatus Aerophobetes bacterium]|uniref:HTH iclR-type domain-containing protein n=1 Tax=Aerophobetes bacterium TaxID=2030807 RepID=A0A497E2B9_UNCAE|nr:MAG: hypothetical protein DRJ00_08170 [Candidatus Aerophobetes bacterium]